jgi:hypothetical protein
MILIHPSASRLWAYHPTGTRRIGTPDCPGDMIWLRLLGEVDSEGRIISTEFAGGLTPFSEFQVSQMKRIETRERKAA